MFLTLCVGEDRPFHFPPPVEKVGHFSFSNLLECFLLAMFSYTLLRPDRILVS